MAKRLFLPFLVLISVVLFAAYFWWGYKSPDIGIDDANIYFVYMKNFADGHGFVWNVGGERVEGFTSLLWTLIGALFYTLSPAHYPALLLVFGALLTFATLYQLLLFARKMNNTEHEIITASDIIILSILLLSRGFVEWNVLCLMETSLWTFLLVTISLQLCNYYLNGKRIRLIPFSLLIILINLTRPESLLFNFLFVGILLIMLKADSGWKYAIKKALIPLLAHLISFGALVMWRISYFGFPFPNTYYAKVSASRKDNIIGGIKYLFNFFYFYPQTIAITLILGFFSWFLIQRTKRQGKLNHQEAIMAILVTIFFCALSFPLATGGDHFMFSRFYQPLLPLMSLAITSAYFWKEAVGLSARINRFASVALLAAAVALMAFLPKSTIFDFSRSEAKNFGEFQLAKDGRIAADKFNSSFSSLDSLPSIGTMASGGAGFEYKGKTIDLMGLNNTTMAHANPVKTGFRNHASFDKGAFWKLRPDIMGTGFGGEVIKDASSFVLYENQEYYRKSDFMYACYKQIFDDRDFREAYIPALVRNKNQAYYIFGYYEKNFLPKLDSADYEVKILERKFNPEKTLTTAN